MILGQYLTQNVMLRSNFREMGIFSTLQADISNAVDGRKLKLSPECSCSVMKRTTCCFRYSPRKPSRKGTNSPSQEKKLTVDKSGQWPRLTPKTIKRPYIQAYVENEPHIRSQGPKNSNLATIGNGVVQGPCLRMIF